MNCIRYKNGNYSVTIDLDDGTKERFTWDNEYLPEFPENMDVKVTNKCPYGCPMCHENSKPDGKHAPLSNFAFLDSWTKGCEIALGGGALSTYPYLTELLTLIKSKGIIANATFHQNEIVDNINTILNYQQNKMLYGIGVSFSSPSEELKNCVNLLNNAVFHVIAGIVTEEQINWILNNFENPKVLVLGYKHFRRGNEYYDVIGKSIEENIKWLNSFLKDNLNKFSVLSFDNLALEQLNVKDMVSIEAWILFYQGEEGSSNMYIDAVEGEFARNSTSPIRHKLMTDIKDMFNTIKKEE